MLAICEYLQKSACEKLFPFKRGYVIYRQQSFFVFRGHFSDCGAEISPFSVHRIGNLYMNDVKCIIFSSNQTYMTIQVIFCHIEEHNSKLYGFYFLREGVILVILVQKLHYFVPRYRLWTSIFVYK